MYVSLVCSKCYERWGLCRLREICCGTHGCLYHYQPGKTIQYSFANLIFNIAIRQLMEFADKQESHRLPRPVRLIFDDFSCGFPVQNYEKSLSTFRSVGISSLMLCQSLSQLSATYGEDNSTVILDNCSVMAYLPGGMNKKTCTFVSEMINLPLRRLCSWKWEMWLFSSRGRNPKSCHATQRSTTPRIRSSSMQERNRSGIGQGNESVVRFRLNFSWKLLKEGEKYNEISHYGDQGRRHTPLLPEV